jgi:hypothetical protein
MTVGYYRLPDVDGTSKYCQNASEVYDGVHDPTATSRPSLTRGTSGLLLSGPGFQNPAKPASDWLGKACAR